MANINDYKIYSFPYLSPDTNHYNKTEFMLEVDPSTKQGQSRFTVTYSLNNSELNDLIKNGFIKATLKIKCGHMGLVEYHDFESINKICVVTLENKQIDDDIDFVVYLVALKNFELKNKDLSKDWTEFPNYIQENNIIGESVCRTVHVNHNKLSNKKSIFRFTRKEDAHDNDPFAVILSDNIIFSLSGKLYNNYVSIQKRNPKAIISMFIIPVVTDILRQMIDNNEDEPNEFNGRNQDKNWYKVICLKYEKAFPGRDITRGEIEPVVAAQQLFLSPLNDAISKMKEGR